MYPRTLVHTQVFLLADNCVTDTALSSEERQIFLELQQADRDKHPDAHACRLKLMLVTLDSPFAPFCRWSLLRELKSYLQKHASVSAACRLTMQEEEQLLDHCDSLPFELLNRLRFLHALKQRKEGGVRVPVVLPRPQLLCEFDRMDDRSVLEPETKEYLTSIFLNMSYTQPKPDMIGLETVHALNAWVKPHPLVGGGGGKTGGLSLGMGSLLGMNMGGDADAEAMRVYNKQGMRLRGGKHSLGFLFLYELMTGSLNIKILPHDSPFTLGTWCVGVLRECQLHVCVLILSCV